ncbi:MAG: replicative DNA helicase [Clostridiaceae bacterium]
MLPNNPEIEKSVLGCLLMGKQDYVIKLSELDFMSEVNRLIYKTIRELYDHKAAIDEFTVSDALKIDNALATVAELSHYVATPENMEHYISALKTYTMRREVIKASIKAKEMAENGYYDSGIELKSDALQAFDIQVYDNTKQDNSLKSILPAVMGDIEKKYNATDEDKLFTGFYDLDKITAGLHPEELTIIAARPGVGKSAYSMQIMLNMAKKGVKCLFVSREMSQMQIAKRILSNLALIDGQKLRFCKSLTDDDWAKMAFAVSDADKLPIELNDKLATIQEIRAYCRELRKNDNIDLLIVDYLQLCRSIKKTESRRQEIEDISRQLKEISLEFAMPVIALSQLSREGEKAGREPILSDLRESGSIEQDADNVIFLHVPKDTDEKADSFDIKVIAAKQRNGPTGYIYLKYYRRVFRLYSVSTR